MRHIELVFLIRFLIVSQHGESAGQTVVDLGTGTGTLARGFAKRDCDVYAIDPAKRLMQEAKRLDQVTGVNVDYRIASAEKTGLPNMSCDVVTAGRWAVLALVLTCCCR